MHEYLAKWKTVVNSQYSHDTSGESFDAWTALRNLLILLVVGTVLYYTLKIYLRRKRIQRVARGVAREALAERELIRSQVLEKLR